MNFTFLKVTGYGKHRTRFSQRNILSLKKSAPYLGTPSYAYCTRTWMTQGHRDAVRGRLQTLRAEVDVKHPIILPTSHHFMKVRDVHSCIFHSGVASTMSHLRERFWVLRVWLLVKRTINACLLCSRLRTKTISESYAPLPACRIEQGSL